MRKTGLLFGAAIVIAACSGFRQPPTSEDTQFSVVVYNRTQAPVFVLSHKVAACASSRMSAAAALADGATSPPGVAQYRGAIRITTPRGYTGIVGIVITAGGSSLVALGDIPDAALPACQGTI
ncbi:MAG TPA: hypothetical protein VF802_03905 [Candidatus Limnocylindrales bacterium]